MVHTLCINCGISFKETQSKGKRQTERKFSNWINFSLLHRKISIKNVLQTGAFNWLPFLNFNLQHSNKNNLLHYTFFHFFINF